MADKPQSNEVKPGMTEPAAPAPTPRTSGGIPSQRSLDAMSEMAERAQLIGQDAGAKVAAAMKDVIGAAAGIAGFAVESARDLVQYMVRRGQMSQDEADRLIRVAEDAHGKRPSAERSRVSSSKTVADRPPTRELPAREAPARADQALPTSPSSKAAPPAKSAAAKKQSPSSAAAKPAKKASPKASSADKKAAAKKPATAKKRR